MDTQQEIFQQLWSKFSDQVSNDGGFVDYPQEDLGPQYLTTVIRLPLDIAQLCYQHFAGSLPNDYHYPSEDMHITLLNLDTLFVGMRLSNEQKILLAEEIEKGLKGLPKIKFDVKGFGLFPTTIYVQLFDTRNVLEIYRERIALAALRYSRSATITEALVKGIAFANVVRFKQTPRPEIISVIESLRATELGSFETAQIEVVTTDKLFSKTNTITHKVIN